MARLEHVKVHVEDRADREQGARLDRIACTIEPVGEPDDVQRASLVEIAGKGPVHRTLTSKAEIRTELAG